MAEVRFWLFLFLVEEKEAVRPTEGLCKYEQEPEKLSPMGPAGEELVIFLALVRQESKLIQGNSTLVMKG